MRIPKNGQGKVKQRHKLLVKLWKEQEENEDNNRLVVHPNKPHMGSYMASKGTQIPLNR